MTDNILKTEHLRKEFNGFAAVSDVNLKVRQGTIHVLIGPNGAGKTTCFNLITKSISPTSGAIWFKDNDITAAGPAAVAQKGLVRSFQISSIFPHLTVLENVRISLQQRSGGSYAFWRSKRELVALHERAFELLESIDLAQDAEKVAAALPYGRKRALEIATTLALEPQLLLLDEPTAGMGREDIGKTCAIIRKAAQGRTVLMVEHNLRVVSDLSDHITVLARGEIIADGDYKTIANDATVKEAYLGTSNKFKH